MIYCVEEEEWDIINRVSDQHYMGRKIVDVRYTEDGQIIIVTLIILYVPIVVAPI